MRSDNLILHCTVRNVPTDPWTLSPRVIGRCLWPAWKMTVQLNNLNSIFQVLWPPVKNNVEPWRIFKFVWWKGMAVVYMQPLKTTGGGVYFFCGGEVVELKVFHITCVIIYSLYKQKNYRKSARTFMFFESEWVYGVGHYSTLTGESTFDFHVRMKCK